MEKGHWAVLRDSHLSQIGNFSIEQQEESFEAYATHRSIENIVHLENMGRGLRARKRKFEALYKFISESRVEGVL